MRVAWFSAGISSFVAALYSKPDEVIYIDVADQHPDSMRFVREAEGLLDVEIKVLRSNVYRSVEDVIKAVRYVNGPAGAPCTVKLKKDVRKKWEAEHKGEPLTYIWGYDSGETRRAGRILDSMPEQRHEFPLIERGITKSEAHRIADDLGIKRPVMYELGYPNNNCIGCVKGGMGYWNAIRRDFPDVFESRARVEREIGHSCIKGVFLDELDPERGRMSGIEIPDCGLFCERRRRV